MGKFCVNCGRELADGEVCSCKNQLMEKDALLESKYVNNCMKAKQYKLSSGSYMHMNLFYFKGRYYYEIEADDEKLNITVGPKKKNIIPQIYFKDIVDVTIGSKMSGYLIFVAIFCGIVGLFTGFLLTLTVPVWLLVAHNNTINITLADGNKFIIYERNKGIAEDFVTDLNKVIQGEK